MSYKVAVRNTFSNGGKQAKKLQKHYQKVTKKPLPLVDGNGNDSYSYKPKSLSMST